MSTTVDQLFERAIAMRVQPCTPEETEKARFHREVELRRQSEEKWARDRQVVLEMMT